MEAAAMALFAKMFADACAQSDCRTLGKQESQIALSGLPTDVLLHIWALSDVDGDDQLDLSSMLESEDVSSDPSQLIIYVFIGVVCGLCGTRTCRSPVPTMPTQPATSLG